MIAHLTETRATSPGSLALHVGGSALAIAAFGAAAAAGHGASAMLSGAWTAPALVVGGALLALPPLYLASALVGGEATPTEVATSVASALRRVSTALLGLAAPALFFSVTLKGDLAVALLMSVLVALGIIGIGLVVRDTWRRDARELVRIGALAWSVVATALGVRLMSSLGHAAGVFGGS